MTRAQIEQEYRVENGRIVSPGKFEGEPVYAPHFYDALLNGFADDEDEEGVATFEVDDSDKVEFPELVNARHVFLWVTDSGFVCTNAR